MLLGLFCGVLDNTCGVRAMIGIDKIANVGRRGVDPKLYLKAHPEAQGRFRLTAVGNAFCGSLLFPDKHFRTNAHMHIVRSKTARMRTILRIQDEVLFL